MRLSEEEIIFMIEVDSAIAGRLFVAEDDSLLEKGVRDGLIGKELISISSDDSGDFGGYYLEMTDKGREALENNE